MSELSPEAKALLSATCGADEPTADDAARVQRAIAIALATTAATAASGAATASATAKAGGGVAATVAAKTAASLAPVAASATTSVGLGVKVIVAATVFTAAASGGVALYTLRDDRSDAAPQPTSAEAPRVVPPAVAPRATVPIPPPTRTAPPASEEPALAPPVAEEGPERIAPARAARPTPRSTQPTPTPRTVTPVPEPEATALAGPEPTDDLGAEVDLVRAAGVALRGGDAARALALALEHRDRFAHGQLAIERDVVHVLALCALGRASEARIIGGPLLARLRGTPSGARLAGSCIGSEPTP